MITARHAGGLASVLILSRGCELEVQSWLLYWLDPAYGYLDYESYGGERYRRSYACVAGLEEGVCVLLLFSLMPLIWVLVRYAWLLGSLCWSGW